MTAPEPTRDLVVDAVDKLASLDRIRLRLFDAASGLKPLPSQGELARRVQDVAEELELIQHELLLIGHIDYLESSGIEDRLHELDQKLASGWRPQGRPVDDVVSDLRERLAAKRG